MIARLQQIHRFPVKAMGGELLGEVRLDRRGLEGDRVWAVYDDSGRLASGKDSRRFRRLDQVFELEARLGPSDGPPDIRVPGGAWLPAADPLTAEQLSAHFGRPVRPRPETDATHFDDQPVSLVGTASLEAIGALVGDREPVDVRHFRTNLLIETHEAWVEESWTGRTVTVGEVVLEVGEPVTRCRMVDVGQVGVPAHGRILKALGRHRGARAAVYARVAGPGVVRVGDRVQVQPV